MCNSITSTLKSTLLAGLVLTFTLAAPTELVEAGTIKKCKDEAGRWHYGDSAAAACAKSQVIELTKSGRTKSITEAPPSASDLDEFRRKKEEKEKQREMAIEQRKHDKTLLATYAHEDDIIYARDRQIAELENSIASGEQTLQSLQAVLGRIRTQATEEKQAKGKVSPDTLKNLTHSESQVDRHSANLAKKRKEQAGIRARFDSDLERYRKLKTPKVKRN